MVPNNTLDPLPSTAPLASVASQLNTALGIVVVWFTVKLILVPGHTSAVGAALTVRSAVGIDSITTLPVNGSAEQPLQSTNDTQLTLYNIVVEVALGKKLGGIFIAAAIPVVDGPTVIVQG